MRAAAPRLLEMVALKGKRLDSAVRTVVDWHDETYESTYMQWLERTFRVPGEYSEDEVRGLEDVCAPFNDQLRSLGERYASQLEAHLMQRWHSGNSVKAPHSSFGISTSRASTRPRALRAGGRS